MEAETNWNAMTQNGTVMFDHATCSSNQIAKEMCVFYTFIGIIIGTIATLIGMTAYSNLRCKADLERTIYPGTGNVRDRARDIQRDLIRTAHP